MSTFGYQYRARLREFLDQGSFSKEPAREKLLRRYVDEWDKWAELSAAQMKTMKTGYKWMWAGLIPGFCIFVYAVVVMGKKVDAQFKVLCEAQDALSGYRNKYGASSVENDALKVIWNERGI